MKGSPGTVVKLLPCDHEVMGSSSRNSLSEMQGNAAYIRLKVVGPCTSESYVHRAAPKYTNDQNSFCYYSYSLTGEAMFSAF
jgi:hypothetical protein